MDVILGGEDITVLWNVRLEPSDKGAIRHVIARIKQTVTDSMEFVTHLVTLAGEDYLVIWNVTWEAMERNVTNNATVSITQHVIMSTVHVI